jgi:chromosome segregation ATPase
MEKKNKKLKKLDEGYTQVLLEDINSKIKLIAEQHVTTDQKIEIMKDVQDRLVGEVAVIKSVVQSHSKEIKEIKSDIGTIKSDVSILKSDVKRIEQKLDSHIEVCDKRFQKIEEKVFV